MWWRGESTLTRLVCEWVLGYLTLMRGGNYCVAYANTSTGIFRRGFIPQLTFGFILELTLA